MRALANRRFRSLLLALAALPILALYLWRTLVFPLATGAYLGDFTESYLRAAGRIAAGQDPYDLCLTRGCLEPTGPQYVTPPLLAWLLQPFLGWGQAAQTWLVVLVLQASLALFMWCLFRALAVRDWQLRLLLVLVAAGFQPVLGNFFEGQVNLLLLGLSGVFLLAWVEGDRWWGGAALGAAVAIKLMQAPLGLLVLWRRRWRMLAAALGAGLALSLLAATRWLPEYLLQVFPAISQGTGFFENHSPGGTIERLLEPASFFGQVRGASPAARILTALVAVAALAITFWALQRARSGALEVASVVAVTPIVASYSWGTHLVLLLLPMLVLLAWAAPRRHWWVIGLVAAGWLLLSSGQVLLENTIEGSPHSYLLVRLLAEHGVLGIAAVWVAALVANRADAAESGFTPKLELTLKQGST